MSHDTGSPSSLHEALLETATEPLWALDETGTFTLANRAFLELTGYTRAELLGVSPTVLFRDGGAEFHHRVQLLETGEPGTTEQWTGRLWTKNGTEVPVVWVCRAVAAEDGAATAAEDRVTTADSRGAAVVGRVEDLREGRQQDRKLNVLNRVLRHNIRNQVNVVLGKASLLQETDDESHRTAARKIEEISEEIINISDKARRAQQHIDVPVDAECRIDLVEPTEQAIRTFEITEPAATVRTDLPSRAPARAPPSIDIAVQELLENAAVHSAAEEPAVTVTIDPGETRTRLRVEDDCEPIPPEVRETIGRGSEQPLHHNDGLGLWIVKWITESVDGELSFGRRDDDAGNVVTLSFETLDEATLDGPTEGGTAPDEQEL